ncbi:MAG: histidine phosphatase family protein [Geitlerinemataceae cyanobacterium]
MSPRTQTIWIARHGNRLDFVNPEWFNTAPRRYDPPLSDDGAVQARELADRLRTEPIRHIFASPFRRCVQTAHPVAEALDLPIALEWGICEWLNGDWMTEMPVTAPVEELRATFPRVDSGYVAIGTPHYPETEAECLARSGRAAREISDRLAKLADRPAGDILFVGHGATVQGMIQAFVDDETPPRAPLCCLSQVRRNLDAGEATLELNCDESHLSQPSASRRLN